MPAKRDPGKKKPAKRTFMLRLELHAPASPRHVIETAQMFDDALRDIAPGLRDDDVTLVVENLELKSQLRGHTPAGRTAVAHVGDLLENPAKKLEEEPSLYTAAAAIAKRLIPLARFEPTMYRGRARKPAVVLGVTYTKTLQAAALALRPHGIGPGLVGETVTHSQILRFGRLKEDGAPSIRIRLGAKYLDVAVEAQLDRVCADLTVSGKTVPVRVRGRWVEGEHGILELKDPIAVSIDRTFEPWSGSEIMDDVRAHADVFSEEDLIGLRERLEDLRGE